MPRSLNFSLALLFVSLQIASLFHGALFGFQPHSHSPAGGIASIVSTQGVDELRLNSDGNHDQDRAATDCDVAVFCEKLGKLVVVDSALLLPNLASLRPSEFLLRHLAQVRTRHAFPRGPPISLLS